MQDIIQVEVFKRLNQAAFFAQVELRIGIVSMSGNVRTAFGEDNPLVGCFGAENDDHYQAFNLTEPVDGRYLAIQMLRHHFLAIDEIYASRK